MTLDEQLEQNMVSMGALANGLKSYNDKDVDVINKGNLTKTAAFVLGGREGYNDYLGQLRESDTAYTTIVQDSVENRAEELQNDYTANIDAIVNDIAGQLVGVISEAKGRNEAIAQERGIEDYEFSEADAIMAVARVLEPVLGIKKPSEGQARTLKTKRLAERGKVNPSILTGVTADPNTEYDILVRTEASKYVVAGENGYSIDTGALKDLIGKDVYTGTGLYAATRPREE